jgi:predicted transcriptional regulator
MLLSINPEHVENILNGNKQYEFRRIQCRADVDTIVIYCTSPIMQVVAEVTVKEIIVGNVLDIWHLTKEYAGVSYLFFRKYYKGKKTAVAYSLGDVTAFEEPKTLTDYGISHPPQSFVYIKTVS